jgi:hypothetical protein
MSVSAYGNKQVNIRLEDETLDKIKKAAERDGLNVQGWIRNAILSSLGESVPGAVGRSEFEEAFAKLQGEIEALKKLESVV